MGRRGFSLVEISVVLVLMGIIAGLAIPSYRAWQSQGQQDAARGAVAAVYSAQLQFASTYGGFTSHPGDVPELPRLTVTGAASSSSTDVSMAVAADEMLALAVLTDSGDCVAATVTPADAGAKLAYQEWYGECSAEAVLAPAAVLDSSVSRMW